MISLGIARTDIRPYLLLLALCVVLTFIVSHCSAIFNRNTADNNADNPVKAPLFVYYTDDSSNAEKNDQDQNDQSTGAASGSGYSAEFPVLFSNSDILGAKDNTFYAVQNEDTDNRAKRTEIYLLEDKDYPKSLFESYPGVGQVSGIATLPSGDVAIFHRSDREWADDTFLSNETVAEGGANAQEHLIRNDTIMIIDRDHGGAITTLGSNLFYMPHGIASDQFGNLWVTDVARHQVMRLPTSILQVPMEPEAGTPKQSPGQTTRWLPGNLTRIWPDIILGEAFVPGNDLEHFCKPSEIEVSPDGRLVYVADGYCNQRIMVFTGAGKFLTSFGEQFGMKVIHSLTLIKERNLICAADRENSRILCFNAGLNGDLTSIGELELELNYPLGRVFTIEAISPDHLLVSSNQPGSSRFDLATLDPFGRELKQTWTSSDLLAPHALARTQDGESIYAADISKGSYKKLFKFIIIKRKVSS